MNESYGNELKSEGVVKCRTIKGKYTANSGSEFMPTEGRERKLTNKEEQESNLQFTKI